MLKLVFFIVFFASILASAKPVALNIVLADGMAIPENSSDVVKEMFRIEMPEIEYKRVVVQVSSPIFHMSEKKKKEIREELKSKIRAQIAPGDVITHIIVDTHGMTLKQNGEDVTELHLLGTFGPKSVDADFSEIFDLVKPQVSSDLRFIMNSCLVFDSELSDSKKRAQTLLDYFKAPNGTIYGSYTPEGDTFAFQTKYSSWRNFLPTEKMFNLQGSLGLFMGLGLALGSSELNNYSPESVVIASFLAAQLFSFIRPAMAITYEKTKSINQGILFSYQNGKLRSYDFVQKMKSLAKTYGFSTGPKMCELVHL